MHFRGFFIPRRHLRLRPDYEGIPHLIGVNPRRTTALTSPHGLMPFLIPTVVPLVPANQANQSSLHTTHLPSRMTLLRRHPGPKGNQSLLPIHPAGFPIICDQYRKNEQSDMTWVKRFIVFLVVGFALFYLIAYPEAAANAVRAVAGGVALVFRSVLIFFQSLASG
jgi:hypothetical protein